MRKLFVLLTTIFPATMLADPGDPPLVAPSEHRSPADEAKAFHLPPGFEAQLVASEPDIQKPINMAFDAKGRLWVTCTIEYPYPATEGNGRDSVKILSDFGPDGKARSITTFADGLNIPIGVLPYKDGAIVYSIPNLWRLRDTDGDGKCDKREVLYSGFGTRDTHGMVNGLTMGFDGWVYCCHGYMNDSVIKGTDGSEIRMNSGNVFRVKPDGSRVEIFARGQVNPFGQCIDALGNHYTACCHSKPITQLMRGAIYPSFAKPHDGLGFGPDMVHEYRGSTALCGLAYYDAAHYPADYRGRMFLGDVVNNCINIFDIDRKGATYTATQQKTDFLKSDDPWFRPVDIKLGPDGALYVADFYNRIIGHYEVPLNHPGRDRTSGRIWRIVYKGTDGKAPPPKAPRSDWTKATVDELIGDLSHANLAVRMTATHELVERGSATIPNLKQLLNPEKPSIAQAHGLWILQRLGALDDKTLERAIMRGPLELCIHAIRVLGEHPNLTAIQLELLNPNLANTDDLIRKVSAESLSRHPSRSARNMLLEMLLRRATVEGSFLRHAGRIALREQFRADGWTDIHEAYRNLAADIALGLPDERAADYLIRNVRWLYQNQQDKMAKYARHVCRYGNTDQTNEFAMTLYRASLAAPATSQHSRAILVALFHGARERNIPTPPAALAWAQALGNELLISTKSEELVAGIELAALLREPVMRANILRLLVDRQKPEEVRLAALNGLPPFGLEESIGSLSFRLADTTESLALREKVAQVLAIANTADARSALIAALPTAPARLASVIAAGLAGNADGANALLDAVTEGKASPRLLVEKPVQVKLAALKRPELAERVKKLTTGLPPADAQLAELLRRRAESYAKSDHDIESGAKVFEKHCAACHQIAGKGSKIGPQLDGIGVRGLERLLEDTLDPNRNIDQSFRATNLTLKSGQQLTGLLFLREEGAVLIFADSLGKEQRYGKDQIAERETSPLSPMPANWADQIAEKEFHDLMAYLLDQRSKP